MTFPSLEAANVKPVTVQESAVDHERAADSSGSAGSPPTAPASGLRALASIRMFVADPAALTAQSWFGRFLGVSPIPRASQALYRDAAAELAVADSVNALGDAWSVVHGSTASGDAATGSLPSRDDVSHIVAGPTGVFAITTINARGESVWVASSTFVHDGVRMPHLRDAEYNALRLSHQFYEVSGVRVEVVPVVVVANPRGLIINRAPRRVLVLTPNEVVGYIRSHSSALAEEELAAIVGAARSLTTDADSSDSTDAILGRFRAVRRRVGAARRARITWVTLALVSAWVLLVVAVLFREGWL